RRPARSSRAVHAAKQQSRASRSNEGARLSPSVNGLGGLFGRTHRISKSSASRIMRLPAPRVETFQTRQPLPGSSFSGCPFTGLRYRLAAVDDCAMMSDKIRHLYAPGFTYLHFSV